MRRRAEKAPARPNSLSPSATSSSLVSARRNSFLSTQETLTAPHRTYYSMTKTASVNGIEIARTEAPKVVEGNQVSRTLHTSLQMTLLTLPLALQYLCAFLLRAGHLRLAE